MRRMREDRRTLGSSADLSNVRRHPVLRQFTEPACQQARAPERASRDCLRATCFPAANARPRIRRRDLVPLSEAISLGFAVSSPLIGLIIGFLGAWFVTWLTS